MVSGLFTRQLCCSCFDAYQCRRRQPWRITQSSLACFIVSNSFYRLGLYRYISTLEATSRIHRRNVASQRWWRRLWSLSNTHANPLYSHNEHLSFRVKGHLASQPISHLLGDHFIFLGKPSITKRFPHPSNHLASITSGASTHKELTQNRHKRLKTSNLKSVQHSLHIQDSWIRSSQTNFSHFDDWLRKA